MKIRIILLFLTILLASLTTLSSLGTSVAAQKTSNNSWWRQRITQQMNNLMVARDLSSGSDNAHILLSATKRQFLGRKYQTQSPISPLADSSTALNFQINDPGQETGVKVQNGTASAVAGSNIVVAYNDIGGTNIAGISYSIDGGRSWQTTHIPNLAQGVNLGSGVVAVQQQTFCYVGVALDSNNLPHIIFAKSMDAGRTWTAPVLVSNIDPTVLQDKPWIAIDTNPTMGGNIYISWTELFSSGFNFGSRIVCTSSFDGGSSFTRPVKVKSYDTEQALQGSTIAIGPQGEVQLAWGDQGVSGISFASSINRGRTFSPPIVAASLFTYEMLGTLLNSHFSANGLPSIAVDTSNSASKGQIYLVFNARSPSQLLDKADVFLVRSSDGGQSWSQTRKLNDDNSLTDQFMPSVAVATDGTVAAMWYDRRNDPLHNGFLEVYGTASTDGGQTFSTNQRISNASWLVLPTPPGIRSSYHGDYNQISAFTDAPGFFFNWGDDRNGQNADVYGSLRTSLPPSEDLILSPLTPSQTIAAGQSTQYRIKVNSTNISNITAQSDTSSITFTVDTTSLISSKEVVIRVKTDSSVKIGTHPVTINAQGSNGLVSTTIRLNLLSPPDILHIPNNISQDTGRSIQPHFTLDNNGNINVVWVDERQVNFRIYYSRSTDNGKTFSAPLDISASKNLSLSPKIAVDITNAIHIVWQECIDNSCQIMYRRSTNQGVSFEKSLVLSQNIDYSEFPSLITNPGGEVTIFWDGAVNFSNAKFEVFGVKSSDGGKNFAPPQVLATDPLRNLFTTGAASDGAGNSYLAYESCRNGGCRIELKSSKDGFTTFSTGAFASGDLNFSIRPVLYAAGNGLVYLAISVEPDDRPDLLDIYTTVSTDNGVSFSNPRKLSRNGLISGAATIVANGSQVYVGWQDNAGGNSDILLARSTDRGATFATPVNLTVNNTISQIPTLALDSSKRVHLVYEDEIDGNDEIYYFQVEGAPPATTLDSFSPTIGTIGSSITIQGQQLAQVTNVTIGGQPAQFFLTSATELVAVVPPGTRTGPVMLQAGGATITSSMPFTVTSAISAAPNLLDFGTTPAGQILTPQTVTIKNISNILLKINTISISNSAFQIINAPKLPLQLAGGESLDLKVLFQAKDMGSLDAMLQIASNDSLLPNINIALKGQATAPVLTLMSPVGGEKLKAGQMAMIQWQVKDIDPVSFDLLLSTDGGQTFSTNIITGLAATDRSFNWTVPAIKTKMAKVAVRMQTKDGNRFISQSSTNFKIKR